jgi:hypothetical protein
VNRNRCISANQLAEDGSVPSLSPGLVPFSTKQYVVLANDGEVFGVERRYMKGYCRLTCGLLGRDGPPWLLALGATEFGWMPVVSLQAWIGGRRRDLRDEDDVVVLADTEGHQLSAVASQIIGYREVSNRDIVESVGPYGTAEGCCYRRIEDELILIELGPLLVHPLLEPDELGRIFLDHGG